jgi:hypothetical protein
MAEASSRALHRPQVSDRRLALRTTSGFGCSGDRVRRSHDEGEVEGEVLDLPPLTSTYDEECSGGETRTLTLAGPLEQDEYQHPLE